MIWVVHLQLAGHFFFTSEWLQPNNIFRFLQFPRRSWYLQGLAEIKEREANTWNIMWKLWFDDSAFSRNSSCSCLYKLCTFALLLKWHEYYRMWVFLRRMEWLTAKSFVTVARTVSTSWSTSIRHSYLHWVISSEIWKNYKTKQDQHEALSH